LGVSCFSGLGVCAAAHCDPRPLGRRWRYTAGQWVTEGQSACCAVSGSGAAQRQLLALPATAQEKTGRAGVPDLASWLPRLDEAEKDGSERWVDDHDHHLLGEAIGNRMLERQGR